MSKIGIGGDEDFVPLSLRSVQQLAVRERRPGELVRGGHFVPRQRMSQGIGRALVEEDAHSGGGQGALGGMLEDRASSLQSDAWEPFDELFHGSPVFQILEQRLHGDSSATEHPGPAHTLWASLYGCAR